MSSYEKTFISFVFNVAVLFGILVLISVFYKSPPHQIVVVDKWRSTETVSIHRVDTVSYIVTEDEIQYEVVDRLFHKLEIGKSYTVTHNVRGDTIVSVSDPIEETVEALE